MSTPSRSPDLHRSFQLTDFGKNSNKQWEIEAWNLGGHWMQRTQFARTGYSLQVRSKETTYGKILTLIGQKERKGYKEIELATVEQANGDVVADTGDTRADWFIKTMFEEADGYIRSYLRVTVDSLSTAQIAKGRELLWKIGQMWHTAAGLIDRPLIDICQEYYMTVPTELPHRITANKVVRSLVDDLHEQEDRLDQLAAAVRQNTAVTHTIQIPATISHVRGATADKIADLVGATFAEGHRNRGVSANVRDVFSVRVPNERDAYETEATGNTTELWHGTRARNLRHIMDTGLIIPSHAANGSMLGRGIYFADRSSKSIQYCSGNQLRVLLLADVKIGTPYEAPKADSGLRQPPAGYDSVLGVAGKTKTWSAHRHLEYNEFVVYKSSQQTIKYAVLLD